LDSKINSLYYKVKQIIIKWERIITLILNLKKLTQLRTSTLTWKSGEEKKLFQNTNMIAVNKCTKFFVKMMMNLLSAKLENTILKVIMFIVILKVELPIKNSLRLDLTNQMTTPLCLIILTGIRIWDSMNIYWYPEAFKPNAFMMLKINNTMVSILSMIGFLLLKLLYMLNHLFSLIQKTFMEKWA